MVIVCVRAVPREISRDVTSIISDLVHIRTKYIADDEKLIYAKFRNPDSRDLQDIKQ